MDHLQLTFPNKESEGEDKDEEKWSDSEEPEVGPSAPKKTKSKCKVEIIEIY